MQIEELLSQFVQSFERSGSAFEKEGEFVWIRSTDMNELDSLYECLPARFPPLFESLLLSYRWHRVEIGGQFDLLPNPPGETFEGWREGLFKDKGLSETCLKNGYIQFGFGPDWYDPLCFDLSCKKSKRNYEIVSINHEQLLCNCRIEIKRKVSANFEQFVMDLVS